VNQALSPDVATLFGCPLMDACGSMEMMPTNSMHAPATHRLQMLLHIMLHMVMRPFNSVPTIVCRCSHTLLLSLNGGCLW
jgi:hypothetical protein